MILINNLHHVHFGKYLWVRNSIYLLPKSLNVRIFWVHKYMINQCRKCRRLPVFCAGGCCCALSAFVQVGYLPQFVPSCWLNEHESYAITQTSRGKHPISLHVLPYSIWRERGENSVRNGSSFMWILSQFRADTAVCASYDWFIVSRVITRLSLSMRLSVNKIDVSPINSWTMSHHTFFTHSKVSLW